MHEAIRTLHPQYPALSLRIGIHTGLLVISTWQTAGGQTPLVLGETLHIAMRLQKLAWPDTVVISETTQRLVQGWFVITALDPHTLPQMTTPLYRVLGESGARNRLEVVSTYGLTPLVGRNTEVALLQERWSQTQRGLGQVVLLGGEAGIGKSRLVQALREHVGREAGMVLEGQCSPYYQHSILYPLINLWQRFVSWPQDATPGMQLAQLVETLTAYGVDLAVVLPSFATLLSLPQHERYPSSVLPPEQQAQQTLTALLMVLLAMAVRHPIILVVEDLHWSDPVTLEWLGLLIAQVPMARICLVLTYRPEFCPPWPPRAYCTPLILSRLAEPQVQHIIVWLTRHKPLPVAVREQLAAKTDGVPLFVEEITKMVLEVDWLQERKNHDALTAPSAPLTIPATLYDSLMARLDRLERGKEVAQLGAVVGREFPYDLLQAVAPMEEGNLQQALTSLVAAEVLYQRGLPPQVHYVFKHALLQEAAYASLLKSTRRYYHQQIAHVLARRFSHLAVAQPEMLAHHYTEAALYGPAVTAWQHAGERAVQRSFYAEAVSHLTRGLALLGSLSDTPDRAHQELAMQLTLSRALQVVKGSGHPERGQALTRARVLCCHGEDTSQLFRVLGGLAGFSLFQGELHMARELAEQRLSLAQAQADPVCCLLAHLGVAEPVFYRGEMVMAQHHLARASVFTVPQNDGSAASLADEDTMVRRLGYVARGLWKLGYPDQALAQAHEMLTYAEASAHAFTLLRAMYYMALIHMGRREAAAAQQRAEAVLRLVTEQRIGFNMGYATLARGWALAAQGRGRRGLP